MPGPVRKHARNGKIDCGEERKKTNLTPRLRIHLTPLNPLNHKNPFRPGMCHMTRTKSRRSSHNSPHLSGRTRNHRHQTRQGTRLKTHLHRPSPRPYTTPTHCTSGAACQKNFTTPSECCLPRRQTHLLPRHFDCWTIYSIF